MKNFKKVIALFVVSAFLLNVVAIPATVSAMGLGANSKAELNVKLAKDKNINGSSTVDVEQDDDRLPAGIKNSAGIEKRIENGKDLPHGLLMNILRFFGFAKVDKPDKPDKPHEDQNDEVLKVKGIDVSLVSSTTAKIVWTTNIKSSGEVRYSTTSEITASSTSVHDNSLTLSHEFSLTNLKPDTTYYFKVISEDADDNVKESAVLKFKTKDVDSVDPKIVFVTTVDIQDDSARVVWITNEVTTGKIWVSTSTPVSTSGSPIDSSNNFSFYHEFNLTGLSDDTQYYYTVSSTDKDGNASVVTGNGFVTTD